MSAGLSGMAEGSAEFFYRAHFRAQRNFSCIFMDVSPAFFRSNCQHIKFFRYFCIVTRRGVSQAYKAKTYQ